MAHYRIGNAVDYDPFEDQDQEQEDTVIDSPTRFSVGEAVEYDPFEHDPQASDIDEPGDDGHSLWDIPRLLGRGAAGMAKTASMVHSLMNPAEWAAKSAGVVGDLTQNEALQSYRDYSNAHGVSAKLQQYGETAEDYYDEKLTPAMKASMQKTILASGDEEGFFGEGITDPWKIGGMITESIPSTLISMGAGGLITKGLIQTGMKSAPKIVQNVLQRMIGKYGINAVSGVVGGAAGEGGYSGLENANQAFEEMMATPQEELDKSSTYQEIFNSLPERLTDEQKHRYARKSLSMATAGFIGSVTAVTTGVLGAPSGAFMGKLIGGQGGKSFWGNLLKGAVTEGAFEEMPQSGIERLVTNTTQRFLVDPDQDLGEGVAEAMAGGLITGMAMGGGMAVVAGREGEKDPAKTTAKDILTGGDDVTAKQILNPDDEAGKIRKAGEGQEFEGPESIEAEEAAEEFPDEDLEGFVPPPLPKKPPAMLEKEKITDVSKGKGKVPGKKPQGKEPVKAPELPPGKEAPPAGGVFQEPKPDEAKTVRDRRQASIDRLGEKVGVKLRYESSDTVDGRPVHNLTVLSGPGKGTKFPISGGMKMADIVNRMQALGVEPKAPAPAADPVPDFESDMDDIAGIIAAAEPEPPPTKERREAPDRPAPAWDDPFRAIHTKAQKQTEPEFIKEAAALVKSGDTAFIDLARRLGQTIEPDTDLDDALRTVHSRIKAGMEPRKRTEEMENGELKAVILTDYLTGLKSKHAFEIEDTRKKHVASLDLDSLKYFNDAFGHQTGDEMLINFGNALKKIDADDVYHISGDEFVVQSDNETELKRLLDEDLVKALKGAPIIVTLPNGKKLKYEVQFSYGTGQTITESEGGLHAHKALREATGKRTGRGEVPRAILENLAEGKRPGAKREEIPEKQIKGGPRKAPARGSPGPAIIPGEERTDVEKLKVAIAEVDTDPTEGQKKAENYKQGHLYNFMGFDITLQNPKGSTRSGKDRDGKPWSIKMRHHYGYFKRTEGKDGDQIDVFIGDVLGSERFFIVDQRDTDTLKFDEHKTLIGFPNEKAARLGYLSNYEKGWTGLGAMTEMTRPEFEAWLAKGKQVKAVRYKEPGRPSPKPPIVPGKEPAAPEKTRGDPRTAAVGVVTGGKVFQIQEKFTIGWADDIGAIKPKSELYYDLVGVLGGQKAEQFIKAGLSVERFKKAAPPVIAAEKGKDTKIITPGNRRGYKAYYALVEADTVIPSHNPQTFQKNPEYPEGIQERTYHTDKREQEKVIINAQNLSSDILLSDDPTPTNGPPIITPDGIVLGGNSRAMSLARAYKGKLGNEYAKQLATNAHKFGLSTIDVSEMKKPVLVRTVYTDKDDVQTLHRMASDFNKALTQGMSQEAEIASMGKNISIETIEKVGLRMANRDLTLRELLGRKDGMEVLRWLINDGVISANDENRFVARKVGLLNDSGKGLIEKAFLGSIIDDADLIGAAPKSYLNKIGRALTSLARVKARGDQWDITPQLKNALELATSAKAADLSIKDHLAQGSLFAGDEKTYSDIERSLAFHIATDTNAVFSKAFKAFAADAKADAKNQTFIFPPKSFEEAFKDAFKAEVKEPAPPPLEPEKTTGELVQLSFDDFLKYLQDRARKTNEDMGINYTEEVEIEETGDTVEREIDAIGYLNDLDDYIGGYQQLVNCLHGRT